MNGACAQEKREICPLTEDLRQAVNAQICAHWTTTHIAYIDSLVDVSSLPGLVMLQDGCVTGSLTWRPFEGCMQIMTLVSDREGCGTGSALLVAAEHEARRQGMSRVLLSVENSYIEQLGFYQRRGYVLYRLHLDVLPALREMKPSIPMVDENGIPIRDQIDLVKEL